MQTLHSTLMPDIYPHMVEQLWSVILSSFYKQLGIGVSHRLFLMKKHLRNAINRGSYMSAYVLLNLFYRLGSSNKMQSLLNILLLFHNKFYIGVLMLESIYHIT